MFEDTLAKPEFDLEDFLDHSYTSLMNADLGSKKSREMHVQINSGESQLFADSLWVY